MAKPRLPAETVLTQNAMLPKNLGLELQKDSVAIRSTKLCKGLKPIAAANSEIPKIPN